jgi:hypothetical protein
MKKFLVMQWPVLVLAVVVFVGEYLNSGPVAGIFAVGAVTLGWFTGAALAHSATFRR